MTDSVPARLRPALRIWLRAVISSALLLGFLLCAFFTTGNAKAQGCSACRDTTAGSAPQARAGLRRGILVLGLPAGAVFLGIILVARRIEREREDV